MTRVMLPILILSIGLTAAWLVPINTPASKTAPEAESAPIVTVMDARPEDIELAVTAYGTVTPRTEIDLVAEVGGKLVYVAPALVEGGFFNKGDLLLAVDPRDYALAVTRAEAAVVEARQSLERERAEADLAREEWRALGGGKAADPLVLRQPQMAEVTARLKAAEADLELARLAVERTDLRAPFDGRVRSSEVGTGSYVTAGEALARVYATDVAEIRLPLDDRAMRFLDLSLDERHQPGPVVDIRTEFAGKRHHWSGRIIRTEGTIDPQSRRLYAVVEVADPYRTDRDEGRPPLAVGMFVTASVSGSVAERVYALPAAAFRRPGEVLVVDDEGILRARSVDVLRSERDRIIVSKGLRPGERVVIDHPAHVFVGSMVTVSSPKTSPSLARADQP